MPVGKPTDDGGITLGSRFTREAGGLGRVGEWKCPSCGKANTGRVEHGCVHCESGDQRKGEAGKPLARVASPVSLSPPVAPPPARIQPKAERGAGDAAGSGQATVRVIRILEYLIHPGQSNDEGLRRSLVGRAEFPWGTLTATIVDSLDARQEDLLQLARRQPGVWLANPDTLRVARAPSPITVPRETFTATAGTITNVRTHLNVPPGLGPLVPPDAIALAETITRLGGYRLAYTLALALDNLSNELEEISEPEKFLSAEACSDLAQALMQEIPPDWQGDVASVDATPATPGEEDEARVLARERIRAAQEGSAPVASPWVDPTQAGTTKL